jgi:chloride channel protein, CIC family
MPGLSLRRCIEAAVLGLLSGLACVLLRLFFRLLQWLVTGHTGLLSVAALDMPLWRRVITPALGGFAALTVTWLARRTTRSKSVEYVEAVRLEDGRIAYLPTLWRTLSAACSVASGAAVGREGSMIQFAAATVSFVGQHRRRSSLTLPLQVACGVAAAVAAAYEAPLAGALFALEIALGKLELEALPVLFVASFTGAAISRWLLGAGPLFALPHSVPLHLQDASFVLPLVLLCGLLGPLYLWLIRSLRMARHLPLALFWSGLVVGLLSLFATEVWGNADSALLDIVHASAGLHTIAFILLLRLCASVVCVGTGTIGGIFTPTLFVGAATGLLLSRFLHAPHAMLFVLLGMTCLLAAATHAPWMAAFMTVELTGQWHILPLAVVCSWIAWQIARRLSRHSLYAIASDLPAALPREDLVPQPLSS